MKKDLFKKLSLADVSWKFNKRAPFNNKCVKIIFYDFATKQTHGKNGWKFEGLQHSLYK